jgi:hypothetical protein
MYDCTQIIRANKRNYVLNEIGFRAWDSQLKNQPKT